MTWREDFESGRDEFRRFQEESGGSAASRELEDRLEALRLFAEALTETLPRLILDGCKSNEECSSVEEHVEHLWSEAKEKARRG